MATLGVVWVWVVAHPQCKQNPQPKNEEVSLGEQGPTTTLPSEGFCECQVTYRDFGKELRIRVLKFAVRLCGFEGC